MLIWYGYVATLQRFRYFGVELQLTNLANQDLLLHGLEVVYPAAALLLLIALCLLGVHALVNGALLPRRPHWASWTAVALGLSGTALLIRAVIGIQSTKIAASEWPGTTPLCLALSAPVLVYALWLARSSGEGGWRDRTADVERNGRRVAVAVAVVGLFWAANSLAGELGVARAYDDARRLDQLPEVVLYTKDPLADAPAKTLHADLGKDATFRHRYRNLRLLLASGGRLFLVPLTWGPADTTAQLSTFVVPYDDDVRLQLIPQPPG